MSGEKNMHESGQSDAAAKHVCAPPTIPQGLTVPIQPDWTCGVCQRVWRDVGGLVRYWNEIVGPSVFHAEAEAMHRVGRSVDEFLADGMTDV
jgi:hypothetical protein